jgi:protein involved in polysaccharide export with SLBB domain
MKTFLLFASLGLLVVVTGCQHPGPRFDPRNPASFTGNATTDLSLQTLAITNRVSPDLLKPSQELFTLGPGDRVEIQLLDDIGSTATSTVGPDGKLYFNLLPGVDVWGLTLTQAKDLLEREFAKYMKEKPQISITLREVASKRIWVLGRFENPGVYSITNSTTLLDAILLAGGPANFTGERDLSVANNTDDLADLQHSFVVRKGKMLPVDFYRLLKQGDMSQNIYLQPDDFIYMPPMTSRSVYVMGAVSRPQAVAYSDDLTLVGAIATAGWKIPYAYLHSVAIVRGSLSNPKIAIVDCNDILRGRATDIKLEPRDIVYVPLKPYRRLSLYWDLITTTFTSSVAINEGARAVLKNPPPTTGILIPFGSTITVTPGTTPPAH